MIRIRAIEVSGTSVRGSFRGRIEIGPGLQVITAENRYGKSTAFAAAVWCLGVEQIYGATAGDANIFPEAARSQLEVNGERDVRIESSQARLELERKDGAALQLVRGITGEDPMQIGFDDGMSKGNLKVGYGSSQSEAAGFQARFRSWAQLPEFRLMSSRGGEYPIYLENLAALFLIEQIRGWTDVQAEQVHRYGLQEVADGCLEYILGLDDWLRARLRRQQALSRGAALKEEANVIAAEFTQLLEKEGWSGELTTRGPVHSVAKKWADVDALTLVKERYNFDFSAEQSRLNKRLDALNSELAAPPETRPGTAPTLSSQDLLALKERRHELQSKLASLRAQLGEQEPLLQSVEDRRSSARDLLQLKRDGIGILPSAECPTCHQSVTPESLELREQTADALALHVDSLGRQRQLLLRNIQVLKAETIAAAAEVQRSDKEFYQAERSLKLVNASFGPSREEAVKIATEIMKVERELDRNRFLHRRLMDLQARVQKWVARVSDLAPPEASEPARPSQLTAFEDAFRRNIVALGVGGVSEREAASLRLDEHYEPLLGHRALPAYGSASDRARLVLSHALALLDCGDRHPGFVVLDEPIQQNPDPTHRARLIEFLCDQGPKLRGQAVVFTSLVKAEIGQLKRAGVSVQQLDGRFLQLVD